MIRGFFNALSINAAAKAIFKSNKIFILTGAGISASAGIPTFRGTDGLWSQKELQFFADSESWLTHPQECWIAYEKYRAITSCAKPTPAHYAIKALQDIHPTVIATTNVDSLHFKTGALAYEIHGCLDELVCISCKRIQEIPQHSLSTCPTCRCTSLMRHNVVLFGEEVRYVREIDAALDDADVIVFVGNSGQVTDIGEMARMAKKDNKFVIDINTAKETPASRYANIHIRLSADETLTKIVQKIYKLRRQK